MSSLPTRVTAFSGKQTVAAGDLLSVAHSLKQLVDQFPDSQILIFDDRSGAQVDMNLHGTLDEVLRRLPAGAAAQAGISQTEPVTVRSAGRPKLGVIGREVTLLPRHWEWLAGQPGGASVAIRKLVEHAQRDSRETDQIRLAREASYKFMSAMAGDLPGFEEATRALFAGNQAQLASCVARWPEDVRAYATALAQPGWSPKP